jgi:chromosome segregation ATPase
MANPRIEVEIGAKVDGLSTGVNQATQQLNKLENAVNQATPEINKLTRATSQYNSVGTDFARIIQDAPFGIIGVGNNITQLAGSFQQLKTQTGSTSQALKTAFSSIFSAGNLLVLGVSAITTVFTLYQQGVFDSILGNKELEKSFKDLAQSVKSATANVAGESAQINALRGIIEDETNSREKRLEAFERLQKKYPAIFSNGEKEKALNGQLTKSYDLLSKSIIQRAEASIAEQELPNLVKQKQLVDAELTAKQQLLKTELELLDTRNKLTPLSQTFSGSDFEQAQRRIKDLSDEVSGLSVTQKGLQINIDGFTESIVSYADEFQGLLEPLNSNLNTTADLASKIERSFTNISKLPSIGLPRSGDVEALRARFERLQQGGQIELTPQQRLEQAIANAPGIGTKLPFQPLADGFNKVADQIQLRVEDLSEAFTGLGSVIGKAFKNPQLGTFLGQFAQFVTKIIAGAFAVAKANAVAGATQSSLFTGPAAVFTLPAFIATAVGLVASAFASIKGGAGSSSSLGATGGGIGSSFTGLGATGGLFNQNREIRGELVARGSDLVYVFNEASNRINKG